MNNEEFEKHQNDILSKMWSHDIFSLTNREIHKLIENIMYQMFLIQVMDVSIETRIGEDGDSVDIKIKGIPYIDENNLDSNDLEDIEYEDY